MLGTALELGRFWLATKSSISLHSLSQQKAKFKRRGKPILEQSMLLFKSSLGPPSKQEVWHSQPTVTVRDYKRYTVMKYQTQEQV